MLLLMMMTMTMMTTVTMMTLERVMWHPMTAVPDIQRCLREKPVGANLKPRILVRCSACCMQCIHVGMHLTVDIYIRNVYTYVCTVCAVFVMYMYA